MSQVQGRRPLGIVQRDAEYGQGLMCEYWGKRPSVIYTKRPVNVVEWVLYGVTVAIALGAILFNFWGGK